MSGAIHFAFLPLLFTHWLGFEFMMNYAVLLGFSVAVILSVKRSIPSNSVLISIFFIVPAFVWINVASNIGVDNEYLVKYSYHYLSVFVLAAFIMLSGKWRDDSLVLIAKLIFWIVFLSIFLEFVGVNFLGISKAQFPAVKYIPTYFSDYMGWHRPFGLTGQPSVNGCILLLSYLLLRQLNIAELKHIIMLSLGVILTISGQAYLSTTIILLLLYVRKYKFIELQVCLMLFGFGLFLLVLSTNIFDKISMDYLIHTLIKQSHIHSIGVLDFFQFMFGAMGLAAVDVDRSSEVFFVESVLRYGVVFTILYWGFIWFLVRGATMPVTWFIACLLTSLHYPTVYYIQAQVILGLLYVCGTRNWSVSFVYKQTLNNSKYR